MINYKLFYESTEKESKKNIDHDWKNSWIFSNFYTPKNSNDNPLIIDNLYWNNTEQYFQAQKFNGEDATKKDKEYFEIIRKADSPGKIKVLGSQKKYYQAGTWPLNNGKNWIIKERGKVVIGEDIRKINDLIEEYKNNAIIRKDWEEVRIPIMVNAVIHKFQQYKDLRRILIDEISDNDYLVENTTRDGIWADKGDRGTGEKGNNYLGKILTVLHHVLKYGNCKKMSDELRAKVKINGVEIKMSKIEKIERVEKKKKVIIEEEEDVVIFNPKRMKLSHDSWVDIGILSEELEINYSKLWDLKPKEKDTFLFFGKKTTFPRYHQSYCVPYKFSGKVHEPLPLPEILRGVKEFFDGIYGKFDQVLVNWYTNGLDYISAHKDDESEIVKDSPIVSISLGVERTFRIRDENKKIVKDIKMPNRIVLVMGGKFQTYYYHEVPKVQGNKGEALGSRINITLRQFNRDNKKNEKPKKKDIKDDYDIIIESANKLVGEISEFEDDRERSVCKNEIFKVLLDYRKYRDFTSSFDKMCGIFRKYTGTCDRFISEIDISKGDEGLSEKFNEYIGVKETEEDEKTEKSKKSYEFFEECDVKTQCIKIGNPARPEKGTLRYTYGPDMNIKKWMDMSENLYVGRRGRVFISGNIFNYPDSKWRNPYTLKEYSLEESLKKYRQHILSSDLKDKLDELSGKTLGCFCDQNSGCHAKVLVELYKEYFATSATEKKEEDDIDLKRNYRYEEEEEEDSFFYEEEEEDEFEFQWKTKFTFNVGDYVSLFLLNIGPSCGKIIEKLENSKYVVRLWNGKIVIMRHSDLIKIDKISYEQCKKFQQEPVRERSEKQKDKQKDKDKHKDTNSEYSECSKLLQQENIKDKKDFKRWILKNHPDKFIGTVEELHQAQEKVKLIIPCFNMVYGKK